MPLGPNPQVIFAWSLNPEEVVRAEERFASPLAARLKAAATAAAAGFRVAFHFDPLIYFPGWEEAYRRTVAALGEAVPSRGHCLDQPGGPEVYAGHAAPDPPALPRQPGGGPGDGPGPGRQAALLQEPAGGDVRPPAGIFVPRRRPEPRLYLCMESSRVWREVFGLAPTAEELARGWTARSSPPIKEKDSCHFARICAWRPRSAFLLEGEEFQQPQTHPVGSEMLLLQQAFDGLDPFQVLQGILPAIGMGPGRIETIMKGFLPVTQGGLAHPGEREIWSMVSIRWLERVF